MADRICVAQIGAAHGIRGEVRLRSFTADPMAVDLVRAAGERGRQAALRDRGAAAGEGSSSWRGLRGVADRDAAEKLTNIELYVPRDKLPPAEDDEFYHADLVGLAAVTPDGAALGTVTAVLNFGAGDFLRSSRASGEPLMVPFTDAPCRRSTSQARPHGRGAARDRRVNVTMWRATILTLSRRCFPDRWA